MAVITNVSQMHRDIRKAINLMIKTDQHLNTAKAALNSKSDSRYAAMCDVQVSLIKAKRILQHFHKG